MKKIIGFTLVLFIVGSFAFISTNNTPQAQIGLAVGQKAPGLAFANPQGKIIKLSSLKGNVVLIDFWTYTCINCIRTLPHLTRWDETYRDDGLVIIGVHTPEFEFEKNMKMFKMPSISMK